MGRSSALLALMGMLVGGVLLAVVVINGTSAGTPAALSPAAIAVATRSLPPYWVVRPSDTYGSIAAANHLSVAQLGTLNPGQDPTDLIPGQRLALRTPAGTPNARARPAVPAHWTVRAGDSYSSIAARIPGVTVGDIAQLNPRVNPTLLVPGTRLRLRP